MNSLSWMIYFIAVIPSMLSGAVFIGMMTTVIVSILYLISWGGDTPFDWEEGELKKRWVKVRWMHMVTASVIIINAFVPSHKVILMMVASEMGEEYKEPLTNEVKELYGLIKDTIKSHSNEE